MHLIRRNEHEGARWRSAIAPFRPRDIAGLAHEAIELRVGDVVAVDPEAIDRDLVDRRFLDPKNLRAHLETAWLDPHHAVTGKRRSIIGAQANAWRRRIAHWPPP